MASKQDLVTIIAIIPTKWPAVTGRWPRTAAEMRLYAESWYAELGDLHPRTLALALESFSVECREFPPTPGQLRQRTLALTRAPDQAVPSPEAALAEVWDQVRGVGYYGTPEWSHPALAKAVAAVGGWQAVCNSENPEAFRAHFLRLYEGFARSAQHNADLTPALREAAGGAPAAIRDVLHKALPTHEAVPGSGGA